MQHLSEDIISRYISNEASFDEIVQVDKHTAECEECSMRIETLFYLRDNFNSIWNSWSIAEHRKINRDLKILESLERISEANPNLTEQIRDCFKRFTEGIELSVHVLIDRIRNLTTLARGTMPGEYGFRLKPLAAGIGDGNQDRITNKIEKASDLVLQQNVEEAVSELESLADIDARVSQSVTSEIRLEDNKIIEVVSDSRQGRISVKLWANDMKKPPPLAILVSRENPTDVYVSTFENIEEADYLLAEFRNVDTGQFDIIC
ncbi:hypothetical protein GF312_07490 [Candidatus Poribacteria bacterium]|nr:hypothetical protein [Candidatus Poribacteria bacterium]